MTFSLRPILTNMGKLPALNKNLEGPMELTSTNTKILSYEGVR
jgi:hypothetical protein